MTLDKGRRELEYGRETSQFRAFFSITRNGTSTIMSSRVLTRYINVCCKQNGLLVSSRSPDLRQLDGGVAAIRAAADKTEHSATRDGQTEMDGVRGRSREF